MYIIYEKNYSAQYPEDATITIHILPNGITYEEAKDMLKKRYQTFLENKIRGYGENNVIKGSGDDVFAIQSIFGWKDDQYCITQLTLFGTWQDSNTIEFCEGCHFVNWECDN